MTYGAIYQNTGMCKLTTTLPSEVAYWNKYLKLILDVDNSACQKQITKTKVKLVRNMIVTGKTSTG